MILGIPHLFQWPITVNYCSNFISQLSHLILAYIYVILHMHNVRKSYICKLWKEFAARQTGGDHLWLVQTSQLVPGSITVYSMGPSGARGARSLPPAAIMGQSRQAALRGLPHSAAWRQFFRTADAGVLLTPSHFLIGRPIMSKCPVDDELPEISPKDMALRKEYKNELLCVFWQHWKRKYLRSLPPYKGGPVRTASRLVQWYFSIMRGLQDYSSL